MRIVKWVVIAVVLALLVSQLVRPTFSNPPVDTGRTIHAATQVPQNVDQILRRSCYDCHSNETVYPWYSKVAPASWLLASDIRDGRGELNFSEWAARSKPRQAKKLGSICQEVKGGDMPPWYYLPMHPDARLSDADRQTLCGWATGFRTQLESSMTPAERAQENRRRAGEGEGERKSD